MENASESTHSGFVKVQACNAYQEDLLKVGRTVEDACRLCQDENVQCRVGNHKCREGMLIFNCHSFRTSVSSYHEDDVIVHCDEELFGEWMLGGT